VRVAIVEKALDGMKTIVGFAFVSLDPGKFGKLPTAGQRVAFQGSSMKARWKCGNSW
jgi:hypothetical protein